MAVKNYFPVKITNPGDGHIVPLFPNQSFIVTLTGKNPELSYESKFFELVETKKTNNNTSFVFEQTFNLDCWHGFSKVFLGEVVVMSENSLGSLCVMLDVPKSHCTSNRVTIINPDSSVVKIDSNDLIEVVIYDDFLNAEICNEKWKYHIISGDSGVIYESIGYFEIPIGSYCQIMPLFNVDNCFFHHHARSSLTDEAICKEHHYWFKCVSQNYKVGTYSGGKLIFESENNVYKILNITVNSKPNKYRLFNVDDLDDVEDGKLFPTHRNLIPYSRDSLLRHNITLQLKSNTELY